jgi:beta-lactamase regulating signal transducer with metallopeptidase domain
MVVPVLETPAVDSPLLVGLIRPRLLVPAGLLGRLTEDEWTHVLLHERSHVRHGDLLAQWAVDTVCTLFWFNPAVWIARRGLAAARESRADLDALHALPAGAGPHAYAQTLIKMLEEQATGFRPPSTTVGMGSTARGYERRLGAILHASRYRRRWPAIVVALVMIGISMSAGLGPRHAGHRTSIALVPHSAARPRGTVAIYLAPAGRNPTGIRP